MKQDRFIRGRGTKPYLSKSLLAVLLVGAYALPSQGQFTTVLNVPPDLDLPSGQIIGSNTQVNLFNGGAINSNVTFGPHDGTGFNIELNILDGTVGNIGLNGGTTVNMSDGTVSRFGINDPERISFSGGTINSLDIRNGDTVLDIAGGTITDVDYWIADDAAAPIFNISGGTVSSDEGFGYNGFEQIPGSTLNLTGGIVNGGRNFVNFFRNTNLTGGTFNGNVLTYGGTGLLDGATINGGVSADEGGTLNVISGSAQYIGASTGGTTNLNGDIGPVGLSYNDGGTINLNGPDLSVNQLFINSNSFDPTSSTLNMNAGTIAIDSLLTQGFGRDRSIEFNIDGSDVTLPSSTRSFGLNTFINIISGSLSVGAPGSTFNPIVLQKLTMTGGSLGNGVQVFGLVDDFGPVQLSGGTIGDGFVLREYRFEYMEQVYLAGTTVGDDAALPLRSR